MKNMSPGTDLRYISPLTSALIKFIHISQNHICPYLSTFHSFVLSRKSEALWEAALASRLVPQGGRSLQPLKEGAGAWGRNPAQTAHQAWLVLLETPILLCTPHLLRVHPYLSSTTTHTPNRSPCLGLKTHSWAWDNLCLCPMCVSWLMDVCLGPLRPRASAFSHQARFDAKPEAKSCGPYNIQQFLAHQLKERISHSVLCVSLC